MLLFTIVTTFASAVTITVGLRVIIYIVTCAALPVLRRRGGHAPASFRAPAGPAAGGALCRHLRRATGLPAVGGYHPTRGHRRPGPARLGRIHQDGAQVGPPAASHHHHGGLHGSLAARRPRRRRRRGRRDHDRREHRHVAVSASGRRGSDRLRRARRGRSARCPLGAFLFVLASWVLGAAAGALVALRVARGPARWPGLAVGCLVLLGAAYNIMVIPHPTWFVGAAVVGHRRGDAARHRHAAAGDGESAMTLALVGAAAVPRLRRLRLQRADPPPTAGGECLVRHRRAAQATARPDPVAGGHGQGARRVRARHARRRGRGAEPGRAAGGPGRRRRGRAGARRGGPPDLRPGRGVSGAAGRRELTWRCRRT